MSVLDEILLRAANRDKTQTESNDLMPPAIYDEKSIATYNTKQKALSKSLLLQCSQVNKDVHLLQRALYVAAQKITEMLKGDTKNLAVLSAIMDECMHRAWESTPERFRPVNEPEPDEEELQPKGKKPGKVTTREIEGQKTIFDPDAKAEKPADPKPIPAASGLPRTADSEAKSEDSLKKNGSAAGDAAPKSGAAAGAKTAPVASLAAASAATGTTKQRHLKEVK